MSKLQTDTHTTCLSFLPFLMRKEQHTNIVIQKRRDYISRESCEMAINTTKLGICSKNNSDSIPIEDTHLFNSTISDHHDVIPICSAIEKQPLSDNTKIGNWVRMAECKGDNNTNCFSNNKNGKEDVKRKPNARRRWMKLLANQTPLRQICKTNRRRSELLDMSDLKVLHSSLGRIFVTLSALALVTFAAGSPSYESSGRSQRADGFQKNNMNNAPDLQPQFDVYHRVENHTIQLGATAFLPCIIKNLGNRSVSWIRSRDSHILTVDKEVFISDLRFAAINSKVEDDSNWLLQIKSVKAEDAGKYECQVSTEPKLSHFVHLTVIVPKVRIFGDRDIFVKSSSTVQLKCVVSQSLVAPTYMEWRHNKQRIPIAATVGSQGSGLTSVGGRRLQTTPPEHIAEGTTMSTLTIKNAQDSDSGTYTCEPSQLETAHVNLHVLESDLPALMQTSGATSTNLLWPWKNTHQRISETQYYITLSITLFYAYLSAITTINSYTRFCCTLS